ncbi:acyl-CoA/acyl-ACP dehydrogenase [Pseudonocardia sp. KRD-184]|uniref:Acyl-CoA/acyl-ACP dehydrogenase n=1 Tax=Pseudonocardia oceani TaxID=2792013 RepID=A0ABS6UEA2_9PSEU|nr:acyl-CoA dehydrogenase family protein [Pseudonocardia oceani]MBW0089285.1 acyl-CoA/acyl-ACP dehydrogenase [Pseudonocardia oceani]MBW0096278.1 acyl-CoA/acyl-ACP dehydrogenase [Pseudonocardia oceani]MBW0107633.1 acyl-CoA/acyl-ACP dehydrogenase [Pseudonocardia oceani]MBW0123117.1 acyl-CoA/acyl-ACP dehydrogenase [Pseudonocardia oceani]MBW0130561.1 acyl-CoA/acyl-ACP dehydrogenase [Pseudonocardia oceani]
MSATAELSGTSGGEERELLRTTMAALLTRHTAHAPEERAGSTADLWALLEESGMTLVSVPESAGGSGGELGDFAALAQTCGYHAASVPLVETTMLAGWALAAAGLTVPVGPLTVAPPTATATAALVPDGTGLRVHGQLCAVPWARATRHVVLLIALPGEPNGVVLAVIDPRDCVVEHGANLAGEPRDTLVLPAGGVACARLPAGGPDPFALTLRGALGRALLIVGSLRRVLDLTVRHAREREQFGRPINRFQAVQQQIAALAGAVEQAAAMAGLAVAVLDRGDAGSEAVMAAKICAAQAASVAITVGHQVHGAIGFTTEHELHLHTRRLMSWRDEYGDESEWSAELGARVANAGPGGLWNLLTTPPPAEARR